MKLTQKFDLALTGGLIGYRHDEADDKSYAKKKVS